MSNKKLVLLVGPPGSGKSTLAKQYESYTYVNQDLQGKDHLHIFDMAILDGAQIVVDRMNFSKSQRSRYLDIAKEHGYETEIVVLHQPYSVCFQRCMDRKDHLTIKDEKAARSALNTFFTKYERVTDDEADKVTRVWPEGEKPLAVWSDLDGTLCLVEHRRHFVRRPEGQRKDWNGFFKEMVNDTPNIPVLETLMKFSNTHSIVYCSGRTDNWKKETEQWLKDSGSPNGLLFMRPRNDSRQDDVVKGILLDFEVLTRYKLDFCMDDRDQVVKMLRSRGLTVFQVAEGDF
jgi:predicted kinase